jgi:hypothetical protein
LVELDNSDLFEYDVYDLNVKLLVKEIEVVQVVMRFFPAFHDEASTFYVNSTYNPF